MPLDFPLKCWFLGGFFSDVDDFYSQCDPGKSILAFMSRKVSPFYPRFDFCFCFCFFCVEKENLCLYGHPNESWEVNLPAEEVPPELPEPALGINFARDGMQRKDWLSLVAVHSDCWLLSVSFYFGARLNRNERYLFSFSLNLSFFLITWFRFEFSLRQVLHFF